MRRRSEAAAEAEVEKESAQDHRHHQRAHNNVTVTTVKTTKIIIKDEHGGPGARHSTIAEFLSSPTVVTATDTHRTTTRPLSRVAAKVQGDSTAVI